MSKERLYIFDTTLRDGAQTQGVDFSLEDKEKIALALDNLGVDYIEAGWPGANPTDTEFFQKKHNFKNSKLTSLSILANRNGNPVLIECFKTLSRISSKPSSSLYRKTIAQTIIQKESEPISSAE